MRSLARGPTASSSFVTSSTCTACQRRLLGLPARPAVVGADAMSASRSRSEGAVYRITQRRGITQNYLRRTEEAKKQWAQWAEEIKQGKRQSFASKLKERGFIHDVVGGNYETLDKIITNKRVGIYVGVDPTAPSLHVGHMIPFMVLGWAYLHGIKAVFLLGGSTAKIGDPTGRVESRPLMKSAVRKANIANMHMQLKKLGASFEKIGAKFGYHWEWAWRRALENNSIWWNKVSMNEVMSGMGIHARLGTMLSRDNVKSRLEKGDGMSFAEFTYPLMQAWDYWHLFQKGVQIQVGGSDQYGNILFGIDMIKSILKADPTHELAPKKDEDPDLAKPIGFTTPLLTTSTGEKFGKSAGNAIWLDQDMTSPYDLYQYFMRLPDADMERYLKLFTFYPIPEIEKIMETHNQDPSKRVAHHKLASNFVELVHGPQIAQQVEQQHRLIFSPGSITSANLPLKQEQKTGKTGAINTAVDKTAPQVNAFSGLSPHVTLPRSLVVGQFFHKVLYHAGMVASKAEGHRLIVNGGAHVGSMADATQEMGDALSYVPIKTWPANVTEKFIIDNQLMILRVGKWKVKIIRIVSDEEFEAMGLTAPGWKEPVNPQEYEEDKNLFKNTKKIKGHKVKLPGNSMPKQGPVKVVSLFPERTDGSAQEAEQSPESNSKSETPSSASS
ncbi:hypothetical protein VTO42DRAFT_4934 [Malbranchea cinnamomea]